jgi:hypothetical protein
VADPRDEIESSFTTVSVSCSECGAAVDIEDVEIVTRWVGDQPHGHHFDLPDGWTLNKPEGSALCGIGISCDECSGNAKPKKRGKKR